MRNVTSQSQDDVARQNYALNGKIMLCSVIILVTAVFVIFGFHSYARCLLRRRHTRHRRTQRHHHYLFPSPDSAAPPQGLDLAVLKSLPTFAYSSAVHDPLLECAVCLSEFENDEAGRVLPKCNHTFHVDCIDMWFQSHANCPLCRAPVQSGIPVPDSVQISVHTIVLVHEPADAEAESGSGLCTKDETDAEAGSSSSTSTFAPLDLAGISVAEPREAEETDPGSPGFKSSGNRILSLRRIWSV